MPRVPAHLRECALGMLQGGMRTADVAMAINCNVRTVRRLRQRYRETGRTADRPRSGRPCVHLHRIGTSEHHTCGTGTGWQQQLPELHQECTIPPSVLRACCKAGPHQTSPDSNNVAWTGRQDWQKVLFTDDLRFCLTSSDGRIRVYHQRNERYTEACTRERVAI